MISNSYLFRQNFLGSRFELDMSLILVKFNLKLRLQNKDPLKKKLLIRLNLTRSLRSLKQIIFY